MGGRFGPDSWSGLPDPLTSTKCTAPIDVPLGSAYGARQMGDKSPKSKDKNKKQDSAAKKAASAAAAAKQTVSPASPKKGK